MDLLLTGLVVWAVTLAAFAVGGGTGHTRRKH